METSNDGDDEPNCLSLNGVGEAHRRGPPQVACSERMGPSRNAQEITSALLPG